MDRQHTSLHSKPRQAAWARAMGLSVLAGALLLAGCSTVPAPVVPAGLFQDSLFEHRPTPPDAAQLFALNEPMRALLRSTSTLQPRAPHRAQSLLDALQRDGALRLEYDGATTRTASEAFDARAGNCLSLVLMTAALARAVDLDVTFQLVDTETQWSRQGNLVSSSQHVNLRLGSPALADRRVLLQHDLIVDFLPPEDVQRRRVQVIDEARVRSMYLNNRAAEQLAEGRLDAAYAHARAAIEADAGHVAAYNTLGIVYGRRGALAAAVQAHEHALQRAPGHVPTLANLVAALRRVGDVARADLLAAELARREPEPPFAAYERGLAALRAGDATAARRHFEQELQRMPDQSEVHYALAVALHRLGELDGARRHLAEAGQLGSTPGHRARYAAKLEWLRQAQ